MAIQKVIGPQVKTAQKGDAIAQLLEHPDYKRLQASLVDVTQEKGHWVAQVKVAAPFDDGDDEELGPPKKSPPKSEDEGPDESDTPDGPPSDSDELAPKKPSVEEQLGHLTQMLTQITQALGIGGHASPVPGHDAGPPPGPPGPPGGPPGLHGAPHPLKPGDAPPGTVPVGAPAFASTNQVPNDHPWKGMLFNARSFTASDRSNASQSEIQAELDTLARPWGYRVAQVHEGIPDASGYRDINALITNHSS